MVSDTVAESPLYSDGGVLAGLSEREKEVESLMGGNRSIDEGAGPQKAEGSYVKSRRALCGPCLRRYLVSTTLSEGLGHTLCYIPSPMTP